MIADSVKIHPMAVVEDGASIGENSVIGPFCVIGPKAKIGANVELKSHVVISGNTQMGDGCVVDANAMLGGDPQNIHYKGEDTLLIIGKNCKIRELVTMNTGMPDAGNKTVVGDNCLFLTGSHVGHDCRLGNNVILGNNVLLGGHVELGNYVNLSATSGVHQFVRIGHHAFVGGLSVANHDIIPFGMVVGSPGMLAGLNVVGLRRAGYSKTQILDIRRFVKNIFEGTGTFKERMADVDPATLTEVQREVYDFVGFDSKRGLTLSRKSSGDQSET